MALIAHYPLNGDTKDYSGNGNHATNYGATISDEGKIGKCYEFNGEDTYIFCPTRVIQQDAVFSMFCWIKTGQKLDYHPGILGLGYSPVLTMSSAGRFRVWWHSLSGGYPGIFSKKTYNDNKFHHVGVVYDGHKVSLYINGVLDASLESGGLRVYSGISVGREYNNGHKIFKGLINDVRVYDHALSTKEIKELAKAKILHYTFDDFQEPTENLVSLNNNFMDWTSHGSGYSELFETSFGTEGVRIANKPTWAGVRKSLKLPSPGVYTLSVWVKVHDRTSTSTNVTLYTSGGGLPDVSVGADWASDKIGEWQRISMTREYTSTDIGLYLIAFGGDRETDTISCEYTMPQIEGKGHATPFAPTSRKGMVKDISGHKNHATLDLATTPKWTSDSKIGGGAYEFENEARIAIDIDSLDFPYSISFWSKRVGSGVPVSLWNSHSRYLCLVLGNIPRLECRGNSWSREGGGLSNANEWEHYTIVIKGENSRQVFLNGREIIHSQEYVDRDEYSRLIIGMQREVTADYEHGNMSFDGRIDDVRIYATALSDDDIKELYQTRASLDDKANLHVSGGMDITSINGCPPFSQWFLSGGAYVENNVLVLPNRGARAISPYIFIGRGNNWTFSADYYSDEERVDRPGRGGCLQGSSYFDRDKKPTLNSSDWMSNGNAKTYPVKRWSRERWSGVGGREVEYLRMAISNSSNYTAEEYRAKNPMVTIDRTWQDFYPYHSRFFDEKLLEYQVDDKGGMRINNIREVGLPIRYIRDYVNGSTANSAHHWVEVQAYDSNDINVALDKTATSPLLTNGNTATSPYYGTGIASTGGNYAEVDLGEVTIIDYLKIWHYYGDGRTYHNTRTEVSADGENWITVFDSTIEGEYKETSDGHTIILKPVKMSIDDKGNLFVSEIKEVF